MHKVLRRYLDLETQLDRLAERSGAPNFKDLWIAPAVDVLTKVMEITVSFGIQQQELIEKHAELRGEEAGTTLYLKEGVLATHHMIPGSTILLSAAHLLRAK